MKNNTLIFFLFSCVAFAQNTESQTIDIQEVVVTSIRTERKLKEIPISTSVISSKSIEKSQIINFKEFLEQELVGTSFSNHGGFSAINMMGLEAKYILFLIDGERIAGETFDNIDYNKIDLSNIERIEIVKGATSSLYGSNAIGGVINIITKKPKKILDVKTSLRYGSFNEQNANIHIGTKQKWGSVSLSSSYKNRAPYLLKDQTPLTLIYENGKIEKQPLEETYIAGYYDYSINPKVSINISPKIQFDLNSNFYFKERNQGGEEAKKLREQYNDYSNSGKLKIQFSENKNLNISGNYNIYDKYDYFKLLKQKEKKYENAIWRISSVFDQKLLKKHYWVFGGELFSEELSSFMFNTDDRKRNAKTYSLFSQLEWNFSESFTFVGGLRFDYHSEYKEHFTWRFSGMQKVGKTIILRGGYAGGFRSPNLKELYTDWYHPYGGGFQISGNSNLKVEKSYNFNLSSDFYFNKFNVAFIGQYSYIKDKITSIWTSQARNNLKYVNLETAKIFSSEIQAKYQFRNYLEINGGYAFSRDFNTEQQLVRPHTITTRIEYTSKIFRKHSLSINFSGKYFSGLSIYETNINKEKYKISYEPYSIWRLGINLNLPISLQIDAGIDNIFNYKPNFVSTYSSISAGQTFFIGIKWNTNK